jgi:hypothetical protein
MPEGKETPMVQHAAYQVVGFGWLQETPGEFQRFLVRLCGGCQHVDVSKLIWIDLEYDFCPSCLSQNVEAMALTPAWNRCLDCGVQSEGGLEEEEVDEDDERFI